MKLTTLCYLEKDGCYLMLHRTKKENDENHDKWIAPGGKFEDGEAPEECMLREVREETGLTLNRYRIRGIITFLSDVWEGEYMFLYTSDDFSGELSDCDEGELEWIPKEKLMELTLWEGDRIFLNKLLKDQPFFSLKLSYRGDRLEQAEEY